MPEARFLAVLCLMSETQAMPEVAPIRAEGILGCGVGDDVVLWAISAGEWQHGALKTDAALAAQRKTPRSVFVKSAQGLEASPFGFRAGRPITAVLGGAEARLVLAQPTEVHLLGGYMAGAQVYATDQDRDLANDRRVATVDDGGQVSLPAGAFTIRDAR